MFDVAELVGLIQGSTVPEHDVVFMPGADVRATVAVEI